MSIDIELNESLQEKLKSLAGSIHALMDSVHHGLFFGGKVYPPDDEDASEAASCKRQLIDIANNLIDADAQNGEYKTGRIYRICSRFDFASVERSLESDAEKQEFMKLATLVREFFSYIGIVGGKRSAFRRMEIKNS